MPRERADDVDQRRGDPQRHSALPRGQSRRRATKHRRDRGEGDEVDEALRVAGHASPRCPACRAPATAPPCRRRRTTILNLADRRHVRIVERVGIETAIVRSQGSCTAPERGSRSVVEGRLRHPAHVNCDHCHHTSHAISRARGRARSVRSWLRSEAIWVTAKTKTRSRNSSRFVAWRSGSSLIARRRYR